MANMNDVAKLGNVSRGTVSNYVNGVKIKDKLTERVKGSEKQASLDHNTISPRIQV